MRRTGIRCSGTPIVSAACPRVGRVAPTHGREPHLHRRLPRIVVRSYPEGGPIE